MDTIIKLEYDEDNNCVILTDALAHTLELQGVRSIVWGEDIDGIEEPLLLLPCDRCVDIGDDDGGV